MPDSNFLDAQLKYESLGSLDLDTAIAGLDTALSSFNADGYTESLGKDFGGSDISCRPNITSAQLRKECDENPSCKSYNLVTLWNGGCLKYATGPLVPNNVVVYYEKKIEYEYIETVGQDYAGPPNINSCRAGTPDEFKRACDNDPNCKAYNIITLPGWKGGCTKTQTGPLLPNKDVVYYEKRQKVSQNSSQLETAFAPIADYYAKLVNINQSLRKYIGKAAKDLEDSDPRLINEERYSNRVNPEEAVMPREATYGLIPELRQTSLPYLISISVFMATLSIFLIFQMNGFSGQINVPPSVAAWFASPAPDATPFYQNPMVLGGITIIVLSGLVIFAVLYFQAKNTNRSRQ